MKRRSRPVALAVVASLGSLSWVLPWGALGCSSSGSEADDARAGSGGLGGGGSGEDGGSGANSSSGSAGDAGERNATTPVGIVQIELMDDVGSEPSSSILAQVWDAPLPVGEIWQSTRPEGDCWLETMTIVIPAW
jgi:hypothetical protein